MRAQRTLLVLKLLALIGLTAATSFLHHGHIRNFLLLVYDLLSRRLKGSQRKHNLRMQPSLVQVYFDDPAVHYEVWVQRKSRCLEIGLHFEGDREENRRWAQALSQRAPEIQALLGPGVELEEWTKKWTRLHESRAVGGDEWRPSQSLTPELAEEVAERLARYIEAMEPILAEERAGVVR
jgi:hypothetical protein